jgi:anti-anti-sigma regulatory factor
MEIMEHTKTWIFPTHIHFIDVPYYMQKFNDEMGSNEIIFDLTSTIDLHSSFIGFLLIAKSKMNEKGGSLKILTSDTLERIFAMLNIIDHFNAEIVNNVAKISA